MSTDHHIVPLDRGHYDSAREALALAFMDDPLMNYFAPDPSKREEVSNWFFRSTLAIGMRWGVVETDTSGRSAAVWLPPGNTDIPMHRIMRTPFVQLPFRLGISGMWRFMRMMGPIEAAQKRQVPEPHWHLMAMGVHPDMQGKGLGSALLDYGHKRADEAGQSCYLETGTEYDVQFYSKRGYREGEKFDLGDMNVVTMIRDSSQQY